jgi:hypothetical protein
MEWLEQNGCPKDFLIYIYATQYGSIDDLIWLETHEYPLPTDSFMISSSCENNIYLIAINRHSIEHVKWFCRRNVHLTANVFSETVKKKNEEIIEWLYQHNCPWNSGAYIVAIKNEDYDMMEWLYRKGCPLDIEVSDQVDVKEKDILLWLYNKKWTFSTFQLLNIIGEWFNVQKMDTVVFSAIANENQENLILSYLKK